ncbi:hypothetical protein CBL_08421 [Carabus blaptoides fortunei]
MAASSNTQKELESLLADESDPYQTDEDETFEPSFSDISSNDSYVNNDVLVNEGEQSTEHITPKRARRRKMNQDKWKKCEAKSKRTKVEESENTFTFSFKYTHNEALPPYKSQVLKNVTQLGRPKYSLCLVNEKLYQEPIQIPWAKWENLIQLLPFIPPVHHSYYEKLPLTKGKNAKANKKSTKTSDEPNEDNDIFDDDLVLQSDYDD